MSQQSVISQIDPHGFGHWLSPGGIFAAFLAVLGFLPAIVGTLAGIAACVFYVMQSLDNRVFREWRTERKERRRLIRIAKLQYRQNVLMNELASLGALSKSEQKVEAGPLTTTTKTDPT